MNENFNKNAKIEKFTNILGIAVRLIVIDLLNINQFHYTYESSLRVHVNYVFLFINCMVSFVSSLYINN